MHSFKDCEGREWCVRIDVQAMRDVRGALGLNLFALVEHGFKGFGELLADPIALVDVLYVLCRDQCAKRELKDEDFGRAFAGDVLENAAEAFTQAYIDFFPKPEIRTNLRKLTDKSKQASRVALSRLEKEVTAIDAEKLMNELIDGRLATSRGKSKAAASSAPASSAAIPEPGLSGTC